MGRPTLLVDIDGVLCEMGTRLRDLTLAVTSGRVRLRPEDCRHYNWPENSAADGALTTAEEWREILLRYGDPDWAAAAPLLPGAAEALRVLARSYDVVIVTTRPASLRPATEAWLSGWADFPHTLSFVSHRRKHEVPGVAVAVEDDYDQAELFAAAGVPCFLIRWPWNNGRPAVPGVEWASDWQGLAGRLRELVPALTSSDERVTWLTV